MTKNDNLETEDNLDLKSEERVSIEHVMMRLRCPVVRAEGKEKRVFHTS
jgi:hypothetical protein